MGSALTVIITSSVDAVQGALAMAHRSVAAAPIVNPVTPEVGDVGIVTVAAPKITDQLPVPITGVLAANVAVVKLQMV